MADRLKQRQDDLTDFDTVEIGAKCTRCLQPVTAEHAQRERADLIAAIRQLQADLTTTIGTEAGTKTRLAQARGERTRLGNLTTTRDTLATKRLTLLRHGTVAAVAVLQDRIRDSRAERERQQSQLTDCRTAQETAVDSAKRHDAERLEAEAELKVTRKNLETAEKDQVAAAARRSALAGTLRGDWATRWETLTASAAAALAEELKVLAASGVRDEFRRLQEDDARRDEWEQQLSQTLAASEAIPPQARLSVSDATTAAAAARKAAADRTAEWDAARMAFDDQTARIEKRAGLQDKVREAETAARVHGKLDDWLGRTGLQRELVRDAERKIVHLANDTVGRLSNGELAIELDADHEGDDEAFALRVRGTSAPTPIEVNYLSGSQKFRVAISVALAIGRFASGEARAGFECVIIDEGFGSLDKDGLRAAAEELNRLKQYLRRIVLVSHQEEFAQHFPVVIQLARGESGTTARAVRRG